MAVVTLWQVMNASHMTSKVTPPQNPQTYSALQLFIFVADLNSTRSPVLKLSAISCSLLSPGSAPGRGVPWGSCVVTQAEKPRLKVGSSRSAKHMDSLVMDSDGGNS